MQPIIKHTVTVEVSDSESGYLSKVTVPATATPEAFVEAFRGALLSMGYHSDIVNEYLGE